MTASGTPRNVLRHLYIQFFTRKELALLLSVGLATGLVDHQLLSLLFSLAGQGQAALINAYVFNLTGGPLFGDVLQTWLEYGAVLAACLVRKPAAGTIALTINGICQVFVYGTHDPHLFYGFSGLGADVTFALFRYKRYDIATVAIAGAMVGVFWYPIVWFTHGVYLYPTSFILSDFFARVLGGAVGDGILGASLAFLALLLMGRKWNGFPVMVRAPAKGLSRREFLIGSSIVGLGIILIIVTFANSSVSALFLSIGPQIQVGNPRSEEYNPGYVIGLLLIFLVLTVVAFGRLTSYRSMDEDQVGNPSGEVVTTTATGMAAAPNQPGPCGLWSCPPR